MRSRAPSRKRLGSKRPDRSIKRGGGGARRARPRPWCRGGSVRPQSSSGAERRAADGGDGRIEPVGLVDHGARFDQALGQCRRCRRRARDRPRPAPAAPFGDSDSRNSVQVMQLAVVSWPAAMKVRIFARISTLAQAAPVSGSRASSRKREDVARHGRPRSSAMRRRRVAMIVSIADSKSRSIGRKFQRLEPRHQRPAGRARRTDRAGRWPRSNASWRCGYPPHRGRGRRKIWSARAPRASRASTSTAMSTISPSRDRSRATRAARGTDHRGGEADDGAAREQRRQRAALGPPLLVLGASAGHCSGRPTARAAAASPSDSSGYCPSARGGSRPGR